MCVSETKLFIIRTHKKQEGKWILFLQFAQVQLNHLSSSVCPYRLGVSSRGQCGVPNYLLTCSLPSLPLTGPTDLSMKSLSSANMTNSFSAASANSLGGRIGGASGGGGAGGAGGGGTSTQLSQPEITAVRQLIAGYRESAAFLLRSADELENLILQQN